MAKVLRFSRFKNDPFGNGGNRRTAQISELITSARLGIQEVNTIKTGRAKKYFYGIHFFANYRPYFLPSRHRISIGGQQYLDLLKALENFSGQKLMLWEDTTSFIPPYLAKDKGFELIALPHNIESLVGYAHPFVRASSAKSLEIEIKHLAQAKAIFCISREEQWLLNLRGLKAYYLPYYPPKPVIHSLLKTREIRNNAPKQNFLILGSAINLPTFQGIIEQVQWLKEVHGEIDFKVDIAGYGTEKLKDYCLDPCFNLLGSVEREKLEHLLAHAKAILVHQRAGAGALTRIPEMLIAGVPVIANHNAARSAFDYSGVYCYETKSELIKLMGKELEIPEVLQKPEEAEQKFMDYLRQSN